MLLHFITDKTCPRLKLPSSPPDVEEGDIKTIFQILDEDSSGDAARPTRALRVTSMQRHYTCLSILAGALLMRKPLDFQILANKFLALMVRKPLQFKSSRVLSPTKLPQL